ncbi:MAG: hypothetical protein ABSH20_29165 [Tepidisphaeraceae bacterium]
MSVSGSEYVGYSGTGTFTQTGDINAVSAHLYLGYSYFGSNPNGTYTLSSGTLNSPATSVGYNGVGTFTQYGGTFTSAGFITVGDQGGSSGTFNLYGGTLNGSTLNVGFTGAYYYSSLFENYYVNEAVGEFNQTSGTATFATLILGNQGSFYVNAYGNYNQYGGSLSVSGAEYIGQNGDGLFDQTGGRNTLGSGSNLYLGYNGGSSGTYDLNTSSSVTITLTVPGSVYVGYGGLGTFVQGTDNTSISAGNEYIGYGATGRFIHPKRRRERGLDRAVSAR